MNSTVEEIDLDNQEKCVWCGKYISGQRINVFGEGMHPDCAEEFKFEWEAEEKWKGEDW